MNQGIVLIAAVVCLASPVAAHADKVFRSGKGATWDCKQDPTVNINHGNGTYTLKGSCKAVNINGGGNKLTVESSEALNINGATNKVTVNAVDAININGADNTVTYKVAVHGDAPTVNKVGDRNVVSGEPPAGGGGGGGKPAAGDAPADPGAHDCAKAPTAVINEGQGSYKFVGPCTEIVINGGDNTVAIERVQAVTINGSDNTISIGSADKISVLGSDNKISYKKGISGAKPKVGSLGDNNKITQVK